MTWGDSHCSAAKQKIRPRNLQIRLLSDHISTKSQTKSGTKLAILSSKSDLFPKHNSNIRKINFYLKIFHIEGNVLVIFWVMWKAQILKIRLFGPFWPKNGLFNQKEDQFWSTFSKRSAIRPRSDKEDLLGSTALRCCPATTQFQASREAQ